MPSPQDQHSTPRDLHASLPEETRADIVAGIVPRSQLGWADAMMRAGYHDQMMHVSQIGWFTWNGQRWRQAPDGDGIAMAAVAEFAGLFRQHWDIGTDSGTGYIAPADAEARRVKGMLTLDYVVGGRKGRIELQAREENARTRAVVERLTRPVESASYAAGVAKWLATRMSVSVHDLDIDLWWLNTPDGVLDLHTFERWEHDPGYRMTMMTNGSYRPDALPGSRFLKIIQQIIPNAERRAYLQEMLGCALVGVPIVQAAILFYGPTARNGKTTIGEAVNSALGDYSTTGDPALLTDVGKHPEALAHLHRRRLVQFSELPEDGVLAAAGFKRLTGDDEVSARHLFKGRFEFTPQSTVLIRANGLPKLPGEDEGSWRRLPVITFDQTFTGSADDRGLRAVLRDERAELDACLTWCVEGLRRYLGRPDGHQYVEPECVRIDSAQLRLDNDFVGRFIDEACELAPGVWTSMAELHRALMFWNMAQDSRPLQMSQSVLTRNLRKRPNITVQRRTTGNGVLGLKLRRSGYTDNWPVTGGAGQSAPSRN